METKDKKTHFFLLHYETLSEFRICLTFFLSEIRYVLVDDFSPSLLSLSFEKILLHNSVLNGFVFTSGTSVTVFNLECYTKNPIILMLKYKLHCCTEWTQENKFSSLVGIKIFFTRRVTIVTSATRELVLSTVLVWH